MMDCFISLQIPGIIYNIEKNTFSVLSQCVDNVSETKMLELKNEGEKET